MNPVDPNEEARKLFRKKSYLRLRRARAKSRFEAAADRIASSEAWSKVLAELAKGDT